MLFGRRLRFNSTIVRLKAMPDKAKKDNSTFQFYDSAIKRMKWVEEIKEANRFQFYDSAIKRQAGNKVIVLPTTFQFYDSAIKRQTIPLYETEISAFQFYDSAIKSVVFKCAGSEFKAFQFYDSAIKSLRGRAKVKGNISFNSTIVRLKEVQGLSIEDIIAVSILR